MSDEGNDFLKDIINKTKYDPEKDDKKKKKKENVYIDAEKNFSNLINIYNKINSKE